MRSSPSWCWRSTSCVRRGGGACGCVCPSSTRRPLRSPRAMASPFTTLKAAPHLSLLRYWRATQLASPAASSGRWHMVPVSLCQGPLNSTFDPCQAMLLRWLPTDAPCPVPAFATHIVGCGGLVINPKGEVLCVREKDSLRKTSWKLPGGTTAASECCPTPLCGHSTPTAPLRLSAQAPSPGRPAAWGAVPPASEQPAAHLPSISRRVAPRPDGPRRGGGRGHGTRGRRADQH